MQCSFNSICRHVPTSKTICIPRLFLFTISSVIVLMWTFVHIPGMFLSTDFIFEKKRIGVVTMGLLWIIFTYLAEDNQQECFRHSCNWFPLWCLGPWMNHLPPMWWSNFRFMFLNHSWCVNFIWWIGIYNWYFVLSFSLYITQVLPIIFPLIWFYSEITLFILSTLYHHIP